MGENKNITFTIKGNRITKDEFSQSIRKFFSIIEDVASNVSGKSKAIEWVISVEPGSIKLQAKPESIYGSPQDAAKTLDVLNNGFEAIWTGTKRPKYFSDNSLNNIFELGNIVGLGDKDINFDIGIGKNIKKISSKNVAYIEEILATESEAYGTIEGELLALKIRGRLNFSIWDTLTGKEVKCFFRDELFDDVISSIRKRVAVSGLIHYNKVGRPLKIDIERIRQFPDDSELPKFKDIIGLFNN